MQVPVTYWEIVKVPDGIDMSWDGEVTPDYTSIIEPLRPYAERKVILVPEKVLYSKDFDFFEYYYAVHPERRKR